MSYTRLYQHPKSFIQLGLLFLLYSTTVHTDDLSTKIVYLIFDEDKIIASNIKFNQFDEISLSTKEEVIDSESGNATIVVVTNQRIMAYSAHRLGWVTKHTEPNEKLTSISAEDYSALVVTSKRLLSFNGRTGIWFEKPRQSIFD